MIAKEFVQKYLNVKDMFKYEAITETRYKTLMLALCDEYSIDPTKLAEYNMEIEPGKINSMQ